VRVHLHRDTAVATYRVRLKGKIAGQAVDGTSLVTRVFVRRVPTQWAIGRWQSVAVQYTAVAER
jgi:hypothetical protein